jgi:hypothetical protein
MACWSGSFPCRVCISIQVAATLSIMSDSLPLQSYHSILVYCCGFEDLDMDMVMIILSLGFLYLLTIDIDMGQHFACLCMFLFVGANIVSG